MKEGRKKEEEEGGQIRKDRDQRSKKYWQCNVSCILAVLYCTQAVGRGSHDPQVVPVLLIHQSEQSASLLLTRV